MFGGLDLTSLSIPIKKKKPLTITIGGEKKKKKKRIAVTHQSDLPIGLKFSVPSPVVLQR